VTEAGAASTLPGRLSGLPSVFHLDAGFEHASNGSIYEI